MANNKRYSIYNTILKVNEEFALLYNALSDKFIVLKSKAYEDLQKNNLDELKLHNEELYGQLVDIQGIVDEDVDEVREVRELIRSNDEDETSFHLHVNPTIDCNFSCWYCYENHIRGSKMSEKTRGSIERLIDNILSERKELKTFNISFFGGEPLMFFDKTARRLIEYLDAACSERNITLNIQFTSNGYLLTKRMLDVFKDKNVSFQITLDGGREQHDKTRHCKNGQGSFDRIVKNIKLLANNGHYVTTRINYTKDNLDSVASILTYFEDVDDAHKRYVAFDFQRVWQDAGKAEDEDAIGETVEKLIRDVREKGFFASYCNVLDRVRSSCYGDKKNYVLVNFDGNTFNCTAREFSEENSSGKLHEDGHIEYKDGYPERRRSWKFSKPICHACRIAPICGGGCSQRAFENKEGNACLYNYSEADIDNLVLSRFEHRYVF